MRIYAKDQVCSFRFSRARWGAFSNFQPLAVPIVAGPWVFLSSEALYQAAKFAARPDVQQRIAEVPTARQAAAIGRTPGFGIDPGWNTQRVDVMRWVLRMKRETNAAEIDALLAATGGRPIVEVSPRDTWWGARPSPALRGQQVLGRGWSSAAAATDPGARAGAVGRRLADDGPAPFLRPAHPVPPQTACRPAVGTEPPRVERSNRGEAGRREGARAASPPFAPAKHLVPSRVGIHEPWRARPCRLFAHLS